MPQLRRLVSGFPPRRYGFDPRLGRVGFMVDTVAMGFFQYVGFPCQFLFHQPLHTHHLSFEAGTVGPLVAEVPSGLRLTPHHEHKINTGELTLSIRSRNPRLTIVGTRWADHATPSISKSWHYLANKRRLLGWYSSLANQSHGV
jgi:hypothetical protein